MPGAGFIDEDAPDPSDLARDQRQREDDEADMESKRRASGISIEELRAMPQPPRKVACHKCEHPYVGFKCRACGEYRPAYLALKKESAKPTQGEPNG